MELTRKRCYYLLRELECVSCRTKQGTRIFVDGRRVIDDISVADDATLEAFCINCADKAEAYQQSEQRKAFVDEAVELMYLREAAKISTRYDAYRNAQKQPLSHEEVHRIAERIPCEVCGRTDDDFPNGRRDQVVRGFVMWPDGRSVNLIAADPIAKIDQWRDCVWLCPEHYGKKHEIKLSFSFDENFYKQMRSLYS